MRQQSSRDGQSSWVAPPEPAHSLSLPGSRGCGAAGEAIDLPAPGAVVQVVALLTTESADALGGEKLGLIRAELLEGLGSQVADVVEGVSGSGPGPARRTWGG